MEKQVRGRFICDGEVSQQAVPQHTTIMDLTERIAGILQETEIELCAIINRVGGVKQDHADPLDLEYVPLLERLKVIHDAANKLHTCAVIILEGIG